MSRCFPFPPPGYEKKARSDDADLLKKEEREKKHKKEKRDKEEREVKEKREKDRSNGKHREKKDRKEKPRLKKKDKEDRDQGRENGKRITSEEKRDTGHFEGYNGEKLHKKVERDKEKASTSGEKRVYGQFEGCNGAKFHQKGMERGKDKTSNSDEKKPAMQFQGNNGENPIKNSILAEETEDSKFVLELGKRTRVEEKTTGIQLVEGFTGTEKKAEKIERFAVRDTEMLFEGKEKGKDKRVDYGKTDGQRVRDEARFIGSAMVQDIAGMVQNKVEGMAKPMEKKIERRMEGKEKSKEKEGDNKRGDNHREKQRQGRDKDRDKERKKDEKAKEKSENKKPENDKIKHNKKNDLIGAFNNNTSHISEDRDQNAGPEGNIKKRKVIEANGFLHDYELRPNKLPTPASHLLTENGKKLELHQTQSLFTSDRHGAANYLKVDNKERKANGIIAPQLLSVSTTKPSSDQFAETSTKPPHPDTKYLSRILSVPEMEWSDLDDQEWLFSSKDSPLKKPELGSVGVNKELQVWAEALQIESVDVFALPYVIPY